MNEICKAVLYVLLGMLVAVGISCLVICIGSAVNGIGFGEQITQWFGSIGQKAPEELEAVGSFLKSVI